MNHSLKRFVQARNLPPSMKRACLLVLLPFVFGGCISVKTQHEVKPIHITMDVNLNVKVEKALEDFFGDLDKKAAASAPAPAPKK
jgi:hypothetical protein